MTNKEKLYYLLTDSDNPVHYTFISNKEIEELAEYLDNNGVVIIEKSITEKKEPMVFTVDPYRIIADYYVGKRPGYLAVQCLRCRISLYFPKQAEHGKYLLTCPKCGQPITYHT